MLGKIVCSSVQTPTALVTFEELLRSIRALLVIG